MEKAPPAWVGGLKDLKSEHGFRPLAIEGVIPNELRGTLYRNGPARYALNPGQPAYRHWFDGDGAIRAVRFADGAAEGAVRMIDSPGLLEERRAGKRIYDVYGSSHSSVWRRLRNRNTKNVSNTSVMLWQEKLFALLEVCRPMEIDRGTLATLGESSLGGAVTAAFSAHPHRVPGRRASYNFGVSYGRHTEVAIYELPDEGAARCLTRIRLAGSSMIHDFIATENHLIFFVPPLRIRLPGLLFGLRSFGDSLRWRPELGTEVIIVPLAEPDKPVRFTTDAFYQWHFANAYEQGGDLIVDVVRYRDFASNQLFIDFLAGRAETPLGSEYVRAVISPAARRISFETLLDKPCEFPRVAPEATARPYSHGYVAAYTSAAAGIGMPDCLARLDVSTGAYVEIPLGEGQYPSEPVFVASPGAPEGHLLSLVYDSRSDRSYTAVIDAREPERGAIARAWFDQALPYSFHGGFVKG